jgi:hypothetical protein
MLPFHGINVRTSRRNSSIFIHLLNYSINQFVHMMENVSVWRRRRTPYKHFIHLFDRSISDLLISFIKRRFLANRTSVWWCWRFPCTHSRAAAVAEGGGGWRSSGNGGDWLEWWAEESGGDLESFDMKSEMTRGGLLFIGWKISAAVLVKNRS